MGHGNEAIRTALLDHLRQIVVTARAAKIQVFIVPHHRWEPGDYERWKHPNPNQIASGQRHTFAKGSWGGERHPDLAPRDRDIIIKEHWAERFRQHRSRPAAQAARQGERPHEVPLGSRVNEGTPCDASDNLHTDS